MCQYCNMTENIHLFGEVGELRGETICDGKYESCQIIYRNNFYYIQLTGSYETLSDPISFCPFCGRKLE